MCATPAYDASGLPVNDGPNHVPSINATLHEYRFPQVLDPASLWGDPGVESEQPGDVITGYPHHHIVNGDHSGCLCGEHLVECTTWDVAGWRHPATICGLRRTFCLHAPAHTYNQPCDDYVLGGDDA